MHLRPMVIRPWDESSFARGWTTDSELILIVEVPVSCAESAMVMEDEKLTGALGPAWTRGRTDCRLLDDMIFGVPWLRGAVM
jgi:hypothetical protein